MGEGDDSQVSFEKHKIFLYKEDFEKFMTGLTQAVDFINLHQEDEELVEETVGEKSDAAKLSDEIKIDIDF